MCSNNNATEIPYPGLGANPLSSADPHCGVTLGIPQEYTFGDINGDGLPDWIARDIASFSVWYGHGDGVFGLCPDGTTQCGCDQAQPVTFTTNTGGNPAVGQPLQPGQWMQGWAPYPMDPNQGVQFHDVDGDGFDDAIVPTTYGFDIYFVESRTSFDSSHSEVPAGNFLPGWAGVVNDTPYDSLMTFSDMDGDGVDDVVLENTNGNMGYVSVLGGERPGLLEGIFVTNQVASSGVTPTPSGLSTTVSYSTLPALSQQVAGTANAWRTQSAQSVHVVTDLKTVDTTPGGFAWPVETKYTYSNPVYDGRDRQFVGFQSVETVDVASAGDTSAPSMHTKTTYYQGYCDDSSSVAGLACPQTVDYPNHALRRLPILTEIYGDATVSTSQEVIGPALSTTHRTFQENPIYFGMDGRSVHRVFVAATDTYWYDNTTTPARTLPTGPLLDVYTNGATYSQLTFLTSSTAVHKNEPPADDPGSVGYQHHGSRLRSARRERQL